MTANPDVNKVYLGRPWRDYAKVVFLNCKMGTHILPEGWHNWGNPEREKTSFYAEYQSSGPVSAPDKRVGWSYQLTQIEADNYILEKIFQEESAWNPDGVE